MAFDFEALAQRAVADKENADRAALDKLTAGVHAAAASVQDEMDPDAALVALAMYVGAVMARMFGANPLALRVVFDAVVTGANRELEN